MEHLWMVAKDHEEIQNWVESLGGKPAVIDDPDADGDKLGLRIDFPGSKDEGLLSEGRKTSNKVTWQRFFELLESRNLSFMYTNEKNPRNPSMSYRFVNRETPFENTI